MKYYFFIIIVLIGFALLLCKRNTINPGDFSVLITEDNNDTLVLIGKSNLFAVLTPEWTYYGEFEVLRKYKDHSISFYYVVKIDEYIEGFLEVKRSIKDSDGLVAKPTKNVGWVFLYIDNLEFKNRHENDSIFHGYNFEKNIFMDNYITYRNEFRKINLNPKSIDGIVNSLPRHFLRFEIVQ